MRPRPRVPLAFLFLLLSLATGGPTAAAAAPDDSLALATTLLRQFDARVERSDFAAAESLARIAAGIRERRLPAGSVEVAIARSALGRARGERSDFAGALVLLRQALAVLEGPPIRDSAEVGTALNAVGRLYTLMGNREDARPTLERALAIRDRHHGPDSRQSRITLNNLATLVAQGGDLVAARPMYERLLRLEEAQAPLDSVRLGIVLNNLANVVSDLGDYVEGRRLYERALAVREGLYGPRHPRVALTLNNMASLAEVMGDDAGALAYIDRALDIMESALGQGHPQAAEFITTRAAILARRGRWQEAFDEALRGERLTREHLLLTARSLSEEDALVYEGYRISGIHVATHVVAQDAVSGRPDPARVRRALDAVIQTRSLMLDEVAARRRAVTGAGDSTTERLRVEWEEARDRLATLALRGVRGAVADTGYRLTVERARRAAEEAETRLAERSAEFRRDERRARVGLDDVLAAFPAKAALVSFVRYSTPAVDPTGAGPPHYLAYVTRAGRDPVAYELGAAARIDSLVGAWRGALGAGSRDEEGYRRLASRLRAAVWDPVSAAVRDAERVFLVPDGALQLVSFQALPTSKTGYLVESGPLIHYLATERDLAAPAPAARTGGELLVMGGVDFDHAAATAALAARGGGADDRGVAPSCEAFRAQRFAFLKGSEREVAEVAEAWTAGARGQVVRRTGVEASEAEFKRLAPAAEAIHVATHGFFVDDECLKQSGDEGSLNPLLRSGVVLAGANLRAPDAAGGEDGLRTAEEIGALDLSRATWVVLSACDTGLGTIVAGEGVFGLRRAFALSGAGTLVMSLWNVGDAATRHWMHELYRARMRRGLSADRAARAASLEVLKALRERGDTLHPATWGAFIFSGEWR